MNGDYNDLCSDSKIDPMSEMAQAGASVICARFSDIGPYTARHLAAEVFAEMRAVELRCEMPFIVKALLVLGPMKPGTPD